jgi:hypothetical protein
MSISEQPGSGEDVRRRLESWKEIAAHFGVSVRSVQLWEAEQGLPVHRKAGIRGRVYAFECELDEWISGRDIAETPTAASAPPRKRWLLPLGAAALLIAAVAGLWLWPGKGQLTTVEVRGKLMVALDAGGNALWQYEFSGVPLTLWAQSDEELFQLTRPLIGDFDGDGRREVVFTYRAGFRRNLVAEVYCFEGDGKLRWKYRPGRTVSGPKESFPPPYSIRMTIPVAPRNGKPGLILVVAYHGVEHPAQVTALSLQGKVLGEYWHSGHFLTATVADLEKDGRDKLYLAGILNSTHSATLVVLDPRELGGASQEPDPMFRLDGFAAGMEVARISLPESEVTRQTQEFPVATVLRERDGRLELHVRQAYTAARKWKDVAVEYEFGPRLNLLGARYGPKSRTALERLFQEKILTPFNPAADLEKMQRIQIIVPWREPRSR